MTRYAYDRVFDGLTRRPLAGVLPGRPGPGIASHAVCERLALVRIRNGHRERTAVGRHSREPASVRLGRGETRTVVVRALHHVAVDGVRL